MSTVTHTISGKEFEFHKIKNSKLSKMLVWYAVAASQVEKKARGKAKNKKKEQEELGAEVLEIIDILDESGKYDRMREVFYSELILKGVGNVWEKIEIILEDDLALDMSLFMKCTDHYLGKSLRQGSENQPTPKKSKG